MLCFMVTVWVWWLYHVLLLIPKGSPSLCSSGFGFLWRVAKAEGENPIFCPWWEISRTIPHSTEHLELLLGPCKKNVLQIYCWVMVPSKKLKIVASPRVYTERLLQTQKMCTEIVFVCISRYILCSHKSHTSTRKSICPVLAVWGMQLKHIIFSGYWVERPALIKEFNQVMWLDDLVKADPVLLTSCNMIIFPVTQCSTWKKSQETSLCYST